MISSLFGKCRPEKQIKDVEDLISRKVDIIMGGAARRQHGRY
jgi:ABC-type sugar transport system substrate-binding protein